MYLTKQDKGNFFKRNEQFEDYFFTVGNYKAGYHVNYETDQVPSVEWYEKYRYIL